MPRPVPTSVRGPIIVAVVMAIAVGGGVAGILWMRAARPIPGDYIDALATSDGVIAIRKQKNGHNDFVERWADGRLRWRGLIPPYDGAPGRIGVRVDAGTVAVRVRRGGGPAEFVFERVRGVKQDTVYLTAAQADAAYPAATGTLTGVTYDPARHQLSTPVSRYALPPGAITPAPYHAASNLVWVVAPDAVIGLSLPQLRIVATLR